MTSVFSHHVQCTNAHWWQRRRKQRSGRMWYAWFAPSTDRSSGCQERLAGQQQQQQQQYENLTWGCSWLMLSTGGHLISSVCWLCSCHFDIDIVIWYANMGQIVSCPRFEAYRPTSLRFHCSNWNLNKSSFLFSYRPCSENVWVFFWTFHRLCKM